MNKFVVFYAGTRRTGIQVTGRVDVDVKGKIDSMEKIQTIENGIAQKFDFAGVTLTNYKFLCKVK